MKVGWNEWGGGTLLAVENENWLTVAPKSGKAGCTGFHFDFT